MSTPTASYATACGRSISFLVVGPAQPKGSWRPILSKNGRLVAPVSLKVRSWEHAVRAAALAAWVGEPSAAAVAVTIAFKIPRPRGHYGTCRNAERLRPGAPDRPHKRPDIDKLTRAVLDGLAGACFRDDCQVVELFVLKEYASKPGALITVTELT